MKLPLRFWLLYSLIHRNHYLPMTSKHSKGLPLLTLLLFSHTACKQITSMCPDGHYAAFNVNKIHISKNYILFPIKNTQITHNSKISPAKKNIRRKLLFRVNTSLFWSTKWKGNSSLWPNWLDLFYIWYSKWHMWLTYICRVANPQLKHISNTTLGFRAYQIRLCRGCKERQSEKEYSKKQNSNCAITFEFTYIFLNNQKQFSHYCVLFDKNTTAEMKIMI